MIQLVTGGAGFIGTNYIRYILENHPDDRIVCLDKLTYAGNYDNISEFYEENRFDFEHADICDREAVYTIVQKYNPDCIVNFAAESHVDHSVENPEIFLETNILGTAVLLDAAKHFGIKRFHQISTDEVYGDLPLAGTDLKFDEKSPIKPSSPYSASKASADMLCMAYYRTYGTPITVSRCSNNLGPYQFPEKLIPLMVERALKNEPLPVYGDGKNVRDWLYVKDHCRAVDMILRNGKIGEIYNIGGNSEMSNIEVVKTILDILGKPDSLITYVKDRPGHDRRYAINSEKLQNQLGWKLKTNFSEGIQKTIKWYCENPVWLKRIQTGEYRKYKCEVQKDV